MADWKFQEQFVVPQAIDEVSTTQKVKLGTRVTAYHATYGVGEFVYVTGVTSGAVGSWVVINPDGFGTTLLAANAIGDVGVLMSALDASTDYGWAQVYGLGNALAADVADSAKVYIDTANGKCDDAVVVGDRVNRAKWASAESTATNLANVRLWYPFVTDQKDAT
jgi:hypothetical protein